MCSSMTRIPASRFCQTQLQSISMSPSTSMRRIPISRALQRSFRPSLHPFHKFPSSVTAMRGIGSCHSSLGFCTSPQLRSGRKDKYWEQIFDPSLILKVINVTKSIKAETERMGWSDKESVDAFEKGMRKQGLGDHFELAVKFILFTKFWGALVVGFGCWTGLSWLGSQANNEAGSCETMGK
ncbi:uncharacterized protein LY89DRAFT_5804 [Mollisia scopiformis]|uniref:Uncharacterized protein n=1 Tax=Mollisia scopiformis TaxID=149040 RepID=A0A194XVZ9_MOLSC|nr:uncharacterized protein LY89DRAFT_5804 [Mollisia scopiformis]KUJ23892.1 hypothetical protein LY89DRAFT_5804 [Mollisia scopiformis]